MDLDEWLIVVSCDSLMRLVYNKQGVWLVGLDIRKVCYIFCIYFYLRENFFFVIGNI